MKKVNFILMIIFVVFLTACGSGRQSSSTNRSTTMTDTNRATTDQTTNQRSDVNDTKGTRYNAKVNTNRSGNQNMDRNRTNSDQDFDSTEARQQRKNMYSSLNMTEDQIKRYETAYRNNYDTWRNNNQGKNMNSEDLRKHRNTNMKSILDDDQYQQYQNWSDKNPNYRY